MMRKTMLFLVGVALCGCAGAEKPLPEQASLVPAVYTPNAPPKVTNTALTRDLTSGKTKIYWFLSDR